jgi:hypothetical protein
MKLMSVLILLFLVLCLAPSAQSDFGGPIAATHAMSPNGNLVVRITSPGVLADPPAPVKYEVHYYEFDKSLDGYVHGATFTLAGYLSQMLYVSDAGDLALVSLEKKDAIRIYGKDGKLAKSWSLTDFLTDAEIEGCAQTGATLQWLEEGAFYDRCFWFKGPSRQIRALQGSYAVMRGDDAKVEFSASIDISNLTLTKSKPDE